MSPLGEYHLISPQNFDAVMRRIVIDEIQEEAARIGVDYSIGEIETMADAFVAASNFVGILKMSGVEPSERLSLFAMAAEGIDEPD